MPESSDRFTGPRTVPIDVPVTALVIAVRRAIEPILPPALLSHSLRTFLYGRAWARRHGVTFDEEGLLVASLFHDSGLCAPYRDTRRAFQLNSGRALEELLDSLGVERSRINRLADAVVHHVQPMPRWRLGTEAGLLHIGAYMDTLGLRRRSVRLDAGAIRRAYPPRGSTRALLGLIARSVRGPHSCLGIMLPDRFDDGTSRFDRRTRRGDY